MVWVVLFSVDADSFFLGQEITCYVEGWGWENEHRNNEVIVTVSIAISRSHFLFEQKWMWIMVRGVIIRVFLPLHLLLDSMVVKEIICNIFQIIFQWHHWQRMTVLEKHRLAVNWQLTKDDCAELTLDHMYISLSNCVIDKVRKYF